MDKLEVLGVILLHSRQLFHVPTVTSSWAQSLCLSRSLHDATAFLGSAYGWGRRVYA